MDALLRQFTGAQNKNFPARAAGTSAVGASRAWHGLAAMKEAAVWPDKTDFAHRLSKVSLIPKRTAESKVIAIAAAIIIVPPPFIVCTPRFVDISGQSLAFRRRVFDGVIPLPICNGLDGVK